MTEKIPCKNCKTLHDGIYCKDCGEKVYSKKDRSVSHLIKETFTLLTQFEGTFFSTIKAIFLRPGKLSLDYSSGIRKRYFKPISFYLLVIVLYLLFPLFQSLNMEMSIYTSHPLIGNYASERIKEKMLEENVSEKMLSERYNANSETSSKIILFLLIPFSSLLIFLFYFKRKMYWFDRLILATEINIFYLLVFFLIIPALYIFLLRNVGIPQLDEELLGLINTFLFGFYVAILFKNIFQSTWLKCILKGIGFGLLHTLILLMIYKPLVFVVTMILI